MNSPMDDYLDHARREMFPKLKSSAFCMTIVGDPDPKLCLEIGAAIMFDKPILVLVPHGQKLPLALRTIAHKIVEVSREMNEQDGERIKAAVQEMMEAGRFRGGN